jgi:hypothetical protein
LFIGEAQEGLIATTPMGSLYVWLLIIDRRCARIVLREHKKDAGARIDKPGDAKTQSFGTKIRALRKQSSFSR